MASPGGADRRRNPFLGLIALLYRRTIECGLEVDAEVSEPSLRRATESGTGAARHRRRNADARLPLFSEAHVCLVTIYLVWGSSFLFSKIAVTHLPPALFSAVRFMTAGVLLALLAHFCRRPCVSAPRRGVASCDHRGIFHGVREQRPQPLGNAYIPTNLVGALERHRGFLDRRPRRFRQARPSAHALGGARHGHRLRGDRAHVDSQGRLCARASLLAEIGALGRVLRVVARHAVLPQHRHHLELAHVHGAADAAWADSCCSSVAIAHGDAARWTFNGPGLMCARLSDLLQLVPRLHRVRLAQPAMPRRRSPARTAT